MAEDYISVYYDACSVQGKAFAENYYSHLSTCHLYYIAPGTERELPPQPVGRLCKALTTSLCESMKCA